MTKYLKCLECGFEFCVYVPDDISAEEMHEIMECPCGTVMVVVEEC